MKINIFFILVISILWDINVSRATDSKIVIYKEVQVLADGACWLQVNEESESFKVASFNDKILFETNKSEIAQRVNNLLTKNHFKNIQSIDTANLHCGAYGMSLVLSFELEGRESCGWFYYQNGELKIRSLGGLERNQKEILCDGHKWGELIIGVKKDSPKKEFEDLISKNGGESVFLIGKDLYKVILKKEYFGKELEIINELKKLLEISFIDLNTYQHPIGESAPLN